MMRDVVTTKKSGKAGVRRRLSSMESKALVALGHAVYADDVPQTFATPAPAVKPKRAYNRRDMTAQTGAVPFSSMSSVMVTKSDDGEAA